jgi:hypothetical protein
MTTRDDDVRVRPGRINHGNRGAKRPQTFVGEVMRAAKRAGHVGDSFRSSQGRSRSRFGRGRRATVSIQLRSNSRRVVMKARVVRHQGSRFRSAPLSKHISYLKREGVTRDGEDARMFDANSEVADERAFAERCRDDRHHFRFIVSPEDAAELDDLRTFTRELLGDVERDLGTKLDWVAVDHWNTDNPHVHVLIRGRTDDGQDLVISRAYISRGFRDRAAERVTMELGPRSVREIQSALERSKPSAGPASTVPYAISRTRAPGSPTSVLVRRIWIPSYAGFCLAEPTSLNAWAWRRGSLRPAGR